MLVFCKDKILVRKDINMYDLPDAYMSLHEELKIITDSRKLPGVWHYIYPWIDVEDIFFINTSEKLITIRDLWHMAGHEAFSIAGGALQFARWFRDAKFCSHCGGELVPNENDYGRKCEKCGSVFYIQIAPAVITAVERDGKLLLAHNNAWTEKRYSVIAGFVEPGESLEDAVRREIREEVAINVNEIKYFGSQTWPFPNSLMLGFTASYESGEIKPDGVEIGDAGFFSPQEINNMLIPDKASIARRLIDNFLMTH